MSTYRKLHTVRGEDRFLALATAGNLSVTQAVLTELTEPRPDQEDAPSLHTAVDMISAARLLGDTTAKAKQRVAAAVEAGVSADVTFLFGGQIRGGALRLFLVYGDGNFIECEADTPFVQAGETKYGKPILLRALGPGTELMDALKVVLVSFDSTLRANLAVGMPLDLMVLRRDALQPELSWRIEPDDPYFQDLGERWSIALRAALEDMPAVPYGG